ncbi:MAG: hypothetical protein C4524_13735 [Candidatus Zixiibacteriota bacterium]|nr:MAG: hypothetical protein C4524_13735 [candidate division Zixibacteria bacterium]
MMRAAFAVWNERIAPVFDVARQVRIVEAESGSVIREQNEKLPNEATEARAARLAGQGVEVLVCGAISRPLERLISAHGIRVIPFVAGDLAEVVRAWLQGALERDAFAMPGCCGGAGRRRFQGPSLPEETMMNGRGRGGGGRGGGMGGGGGRRGGTGMGRGGGRGRMGGPQAGGLGGTCVCPQCGYQEPHQQGQPCAQKQCPQCGSNLMRQ